MFNAEFWSGICVALVVALVVTRLMPLLQRALFGRGAKKVASVALSAVGGRETKMVMVVRQDLGMQKGKIAAQCGHAVLGAYKKAVEAGSPTLGPWERFGQAKVALKCQTEEEMVALWENARKKGLTTYMVVDAGRTQIAAGSRTVLAIGPDAVEAIDSVTGDLKLL